MAGAQRRYFVKPRDRKMVRSTIGGVRFQSGERSEPGTGAVTDCQTDVVRLVQSLAIIRRDPELAQAVLSKDVLLHRQLGRAGVKRAKFGLFIPVDGRFRDDSDAARENQLRINRAIRKAGFAIVEPEEPFESRTGMEGLQAWSKRLMLRKRRNYWWLLLLLLPMLGFLRCDSSGISLPWTTETSATPFDLPPVETEGLILVLDESPSMESDFATIRREALRYLNDRRDRPAERSYIDMIRYSDVPRSKLLGLRPLDGAEEEKLKEFLNEPVARPNSSPHQTNLQEAMNTVADEITAQVDSSPVTIVILTEADDPTIEELTRDDRLNELKARFKDVRVRVHATTPRMLPGAARKFRGPNANEEGLAKFCEAFGGQFGPSSRNVRGGQAKLPSGSDGSAQADGEPGGANPPPERSIRADQEPSRERDNQPTPPGGSRERVSGERPE